MNYYSRFRNALISCFRLESKVFNLERLYPLSPVGVSKSQTNIGSEIIWGQEIFGSIKIACPKISGPNKIFGSKKNLGLGPTTF